MKQYIYRQRCMGGALSFREFVYQIKNLEIMEKYIAIKNSKLKIHNRKWLKYVPTEGSDNNLMMYVNEYVDKM